MKRRSFFKKALAAAGTSALALGLPSSLYAACPRGCNCPGCRKAGAKVSDELNRLSNKDNPTTLEKKHVPLVVAPEKVRKGEWFTVEVKVGFQIEHPSTTGHWIDEIVLMADGKKVSVIANKQGGVTSPNGTFRIRLEKDASLQAVSSCNLHGRWISEPLKIKVA